MFKYLTLLLCVYCIFAGLSLHGENPLTFRMEVYPEFVDSGDFIHVWLEEADYIDVEGDAKLPVFRKYIQIPEGSSLSFSYKERINQRTQLEKHLALVPAMPVQSSSNIVSKAIVNSIEDVWINDEPVEILKRVKIHGYELALLEFHPIAYNPFWKDIKVRTEMDISIEITGGSDPEDRYRSPLFHKTISAISFSSLDFDPVMDLPIGYLIVCPPEYVVAVEELLNWRKQLGYSIILRTPDELGSTATEIRNSISDIYHTGAVVPQYMVIVGDVDVCPTFLSGGSSSETDIDYGVIDGDDYIPDLLIGRISGANQDDIARISERIVEYEKLLYSESGFTNRVLFGTSNDGSFHDVVHRCHSYCWTQWLTPNGVEHTELDGFDHTMDDVVDAIDYGYNFYYYYGHGSSVGLDSPRLNFAGIDALANADKYPLMVGNACSTNEFLSPESWGEALLRREDKGAINYMGASDLTYWWPDSVWEIETFRAMYELEYQSVMPAFYFALLEVDVAYPSYGHYFFDVYNMVGDPATSVWSFTPGILDVSHIDVFELSESISIDIAVSCDGSPVENALVCLLSGEDQFTAYTDVSGNVTLEFSSFSPDSLILTVSSRGKIPYISVLHPFAGGEPYVYIAEFSFNDDISLNPINNANGLFDVGESGFLDLRLANFGEDASDVELDVEGIDFGLSYYHLVGEIVGDGFVDIEVPISIDFDISDGSLCDIDFLISHSGAGFWDYSRQVSVNAPDVSIIFTAFSDERVGDGDNVPETGETIDLTILIENNGNRDIEDLGIYVSETASHLEIPDTSEIIAELLSDGSVELTFAVDIIAEIPDGVEDIFVVRAIWEELMWESNIELYLNPEGYNSEIVFGELFEMSGWAFSENIKQSPPYALHSKDDTEIFYSPSSYSLLELPEMIMPWNAVISFWQQIFTPLFPLTGDNGFVMIISEDDTFYFPEIFSGKSSSWEHITLDVPSQFQGRASKVVFGFVSDAENERLGWIIDDISIEPQGSVILGNPLVDPRIGNYETTLFTFQITVSNFEGSVYLVLDDESFEMVSCGVDVWQYSDYLLLGIHEYHFEAGGNRYPLENELEGPYSGYSHLFEDFELTDGSLWATGTDEWQYTSGHAFSGDKSWSTLGPAFTGYALEAHSILHMSLDLTSINSPVLAFMASYDFATGSSTGIIRDGGNITIGFGEETVFAQPQPFYEGQVISASNPLAAQPVFGESSDWNLYTVNLGDWEGMEIELMFNMGSNDVSNADGWFIDDITVYTLTDLGLVSESTTLSNKLLLRAFPNPFNSAVEISLPVNAVFAITDIHGRTVHKGIGSCVWQPKNLSSGMYILNVEELGSVDLLYIK